MLACMRSGSACVSCVPYELHGAALGACSMRAAASQALRRQRVMMGLCLLVRGRPWCWQ